MRDRPPPAAPARKDPAPPRLTQPTPAERQTHVERTGPAPQPAWSLTFPHHPYIELGPTTGDYAALRLQRQEGPMLVLSLPRGEELWQRRVPDYEDRAADRTTLLLAAREHLEALNWRTGRTSWTAKGSIERSRVVTSRGVVVWCGPGDTVVAADSATGRRLWERPRSTPAVEWPVRALDGKVYLHSTRYPKRVDQTGQWLSEVDLHTGRVRKEGLFNPSESAQYNLPYLELSAKHRLLFGCETLFYEYQPGIRALNSDLRPVWKRAGAGWFARLGDTLVCEESGGQADSNHSERSGVVGLDAATGRVRWRRGAEAVEEKLIGRWSDTAVFSRASSGSLVLSGWDAEGAVRWRLRLTSRRAGAQLYPHPHLSGKWLLVTWASPDGAGTAGLDAYLPAKPTSP